MKKKGVILDWESLPSLLLILFGLRMNRKSIRYVNYSL